MAISKCKKHGRQPVKFVSKKLYNFIQQDIFSTKIHRIEFDENGLKDVVFSDEETLKGLNINNFLNVIEIQTISNKEDLLLFIDNAIPYCEKCFREYEIKISQNN